MSQAIKDALCMWKRFIHVHRDIKCLEKYVPKALPLALQRMALNEDLVEVFKIGKSLNIAGQSIAGIIVLHGGYHRLREALSSSRPFWRHIDSIYHGTFPSLEYHLSNPEYLAPWITQGAQESLLDLPLKEIAVVEYGSGISSFFFDKNAAICISFESGTDPNTGEDWLAKMKYLAQQTNAHIIFKKPNKEDELPENVVSYVAAKGIQKLLVFIDGEDRVALFDVWAQWILSNRDKDLIIVLDNSERKQFSPVFHRLHDSGATIVHYYGSVCGQLYCKQCTSFITFNQKFLISGCPDPHEHDARWGKMSDQS